MDAEDVASSSQCLEPIPESPEAKVTKAAAPAPSPPPSPPPPTHSPPSSPPPTSHSPPTSPSPTIPPPPQQQRQSFVTRLLAFPAVSDALGLASHLYTRSKEYQVVGAALDVAEGTVKSAVEVATPLATPVLLRYTKVLEPLDNWACKRLDDVEKLVPTINKPTEELLGATRQGVLVTVAGVQEPAPPTLTAALATRVSHVAAAAQGQAAAVSMVVPHRLLDAAHSLLDHYLPEQPTHNDNYEEQQESEHDKDNNKGEDNDNNEDTKDSAAIEKSTGEGGGDKVEHKDDGLMGKLISLITKSNRRLCRALHDRLYASCPLDPTPSHLAMECIQMVRRGCPRQLANVYNIREEPQAAVFLMAVVLPLRLTVATLRILLVAVTILTEELNATFRKLTRDEMQLMTAEENSQTSKLHTD